MDLCEVAGCRKKIIPKIDFTVTQIAKRKVNSPNFMQELLLKTQSFILSSLLHKLLQVPKVTHDNFLGVPSSFLRVKDAISCVRENPALILKIISHSFQFAKT